MGERPPPSLSPSPPPPPPPPPPSAPAITEPIPYEVLFSETPDNLPEALPTPEEIENSEHVVEDCFSRHTVYIGDSYFAKYGTQVLPIEAENMQFVRKNTNVPVPQVFAVYQSLMPPGSDRSNRTYIVMERVPGDTLQSLWSTLSNDRKTEIASMLRSLFNSIRSIPRPAFFGDIRGGNFHCDIFSEAESALAFKGPFSTEDELVRGMLEVYREHCGERVFPKADYYQRVFPKALRGDNNPVFTHNDFQRKNVMIRPNGSLVLIDWSASGWYPVYWEYATTLFAGEGWHDDWHEYVAMMLDEYPSHFALLNTLRYEMWS